MNGKTGRAVIDLIVGLDLIGKQINRGHLTDREAADKLCDLLDDAKARIVNSFKDDNTPEMQLHINFEDQTKH